MVKKLNILNGESLQQYFMEKSICREEDTIAFNECLVDGQLEEHIFSESFFHVREKFLTDYLTVTTDQYKEKVVKPLGPLMNCSNYNSIDLWFDFDMFCQINMLTLLAYLDYRKYDGVVTVNIIEQDFFYFGKLQDIIIDKITLRSLDGFYSLYKDMMIARDFNKLSKDLYSNIFKQLPWLEDGIKLYIDYNLPENGITRFIEERRNKSRKELLFELIRELNNYGLGDVQYKKILDSMKII